MVVFTPDEYPWKETQLAKFIEHYGYGTLDQLLEEAETERHVFWARVVENLGLTWTARYERVLDLSADFASARWFVGGRFDLVENLLFKHARATPGKVALSWEGDNGEQRRYTYQELSAEVGQLMSGLLNLGLQRGDRVGVFLPMIPEAAIVLLALAAIGAVSVPMFAGYGATSIAHVVQDSGASMLICANGFFRGGKLVRTLAHARAAASNCESVRHLIVVDRLGTGTRSCGDPAAHCKQISYHLVKNTYGPTGAAPSFAADDPLMIAYTSGTSGAPRGVMHTYGGFPIKAAQDMQMAFDLDAGSTLLWVTDMSWLMGPWMIFGGLLLGAGVVFCEGPPDYPEGGRLWRTVERFGVTHLGVSPTLVRQLMANGGGVPEEGQLRTLKVFGSTGEPWNEAPWLWLYEVVGRSRRPIINYSGGTEVGGGILASFPGLPQKPCGFCGPIPGMAADVVNLEGESVRQEVGELVVRNPWPGMASGLGNRDQANIQSRSGSHPPMWVQGDLASIDADGFWFVHGRSDDTISVAGKRIGPMVFESALLSYPSITEAIVVGVPNAAKGEVAVGFVTVGAEHAEDMQDWAVWEAILRDHVARHLGKPLRPARVHRLSEIPRSRNGKMLRNLVRKVYLGQELGDLSLIENLGAIDEIAALRGSS